MVGDATAIGMVTIGHDVGLVIKQRIQDMQRSLAVAGIALM